MQRRIIVNLVLISAVAVLAVFLMHTGKKPPDQVVPLTSISAQTIRNIEIKRAGKTDIVFRKSEGVWLMTKPLKVRANDNRINAILQLLQTPSFTRLQARDRDLSRFDLVSPRVILRENAHEFRFGGTNPLEGRRYVMHAGIIHLIPDGLFPQLQQGAAFFISPRLLPENTPLQEIILPGYRLSYINHGWRSEPSGPDSATLKRLAAAWQAATAVNLGILRPGPSLGEIRITTGSGELMRFEIQQRKPLLKLARTDLDISYTLPAGAAETLLPNLAEAR